jgi:hypothetical protein
MLIFLSVQAMSQHRKIGYRHDEYLSNQWTGIDSILYNYNASGNITWLYALKGDSFQNWNLQTRVTYIYDVAQHLTEKIREKGVGGFWANDNRYVYSYDGSGNNTLIDYFTWNGSAWNNAGKISYTGYNANGKCAQALTQSWNGGSWTNISRSDYSYINGQYLVQYEDQYLWDLSILNWKKYQRHYYTYLQDSIGSHTLMQPDTINNWQSVSKTINFYNADMLKIEKRNQLFDSNHVAYTINHTLYTYSATKKLLNSDYELPSGSSWSPQSRVTYLYDANDSLIEYYSENYNGSWQFDGRTTLTYNAGLPSEEIHFTGIGNNWVEQTKINYTYDTFDSLTYRLEQQHNGSSFQPQKQEFYYYNQWPLNTTSTEILELCLYPNPVKNQLNIRFTSKQEAMAECSIYDLLGRKRVAMSTPLNSGLNNLQMPVESLSSGVYMLQMQTSQGQITRTFVK